MIALFSFMNAIFNAFATVMLSIPILILVIILIVWQITSQSKKKAETQRQAKEFESHLSYCRNCGMRVKSGTTICPSCGVRMGVGQNYCYLCGSRTDPLAVVCVNRGVSLTKKSELTPEKSKITAGFLGLLFGGFGVHNFYLGYMPKAVAQVVLSILGVFSGFILFTVIAIIWGIVEGIMIFAGGISKDANGAPLK